MQPRPRSHRVFRPVAALFALIVISSVIALGATTSIPDAVGGQTGSAGTPAAGAQASIALVPVNVRVLDRAGKPIADLKQGDFTITEDDLPQPIKYFSPQTLTTDPPAANARPQARKGIALAPQPYRMFVIFLGNGRLEDSGKAVTALAQFVRTRLVPQDQVAVFAYDRGIPFTTDHEKIAQMLDRFKKAHIDISSEIDLQMGPTTMTALYGRRVIPAKLQARIDQVVEGPGAHTPSATAPEVWDTKDLANVSLDDFMFTTAQTLQDEGSLNAIVEYLRRFDGEKHLLYVTERGIPLPADENDRQIAMVANDGRVAIHVIQVGAIVQPEPGKEMDQTHQQALSLASLRNMANWSGGLPILGETGANALTRIDALTQTSYLLGYQPRALDGSYRRIAVKVNRPDVTVLCRRGYYAATDVEPFNRRGVITNDRLLSAAMFRREINDIKIKVAASQENGQMRIDLRLDPSRLSFASAGGMRVVTLQVAVFCLDTGNQSAGVNQSDVTLKMTEDEYKKALNDGARYRLEFPLTRGTAHVRCIVYDYNADLIGRADAKIF